MTNKPTASFQKTPIILIFLVIGLGLLYLSISFRPSTTVFKPVQVNESKQIQSEAKQSKIPVQEVVSSKGIKAWLVEDHSIPVISISFAFNGGMGLETDDKIGLTYMLSIMMDEGAGDYDSQAFQNALEDNVISMSFSSGRDYFTGDLKTLTKNQDKAFELLGLALTKLHFADSSLKRMQRSTLNSIKSNLGNPNWNAARIFNGLTFKGHSYARPGQGTLKTIANITSDDLRNISSKLFTRTGIKISVAGDITAEDLSDFLDNVFSNLPENTNHIKKEENAYNKEIAGKTIVYEMDIPQSIILFGQLGISNLDKEYQAATIMNYILGGGGFASRLMQVLREDSGLTYGVYTNMSHSDYADILQGQFSTKNATAGEAISLLKEQWKKMARNGPTKQEVSDAVNYLTGSLPLALTSTAKISGVLNGLQKSGRDINYINERNQLLREVTTKDVQNIAKKLLETDNLHFIIVGKPEGLTEFEKITELPWLER